MQSSRTRLLVCFSAPACLRIPMHHAAHNAFAAIATRPGAARPCAASVPLAPPVTSAPRTRAGLAPPPPAVLG